MTLTDTLEFDRNRWRETVRDVYDLMHLSPHSLGPNGSALAAETVALIEERHPDFFGANRR